MIQAIDRALLAEAGHGPNPQLTEVLTYLPDSSLISRRQVLQGMAPAGITSRLPIPIWAIATLLVLIVGVVAILIANGLGGAGSEGTTPISNAATTSPEPLVIFITAIVTETPDPNAPPILNNTAESTSASTASESDSQASTTGTNATSTIAPTATTEPTDTPPPTFTNTPLPTSPPLPSATPVPVATSCGFSVLSAIASTWSTYESVLGCPVSGGSSTLLMAEESFQNGRMVWREDNDRIYVLYNSGSWGSYADSWNENLPEFTCGTNQSPPTPKRGFGKVWCDNSNVQQGLGNATSTESGANGAAQNYSGGVIFQTGSGRVYVLYNSGSWR
jgi:hypothetical protein